MDAVAHTFAQTGGRLVDLPLPTAGVTAELGEPCVAGLYRERSHHADPLVLATWYGQRPADIVFNTESDPHHPVCALMSLSNPPVHRANGGFVGTGANSAVHDLPKLAGPLRLERRSYGWNLDSLGDPWPG